MEGTEKKEGLLNALWKQLEGNRVDVSYRATAKDFARYYTRLPKPGKSYSDAA